MSARLVGFHVRITCTQCGIDGHPVVTTGWRKWETEMRAIHKGHSGFRLFQWKPVFRQRREVAA